MQTRIRGGSRETEVKELAVRPRGRPSRSKAATTVTPVRNVPSTLRNAFAPAACGVTRVTAPSRVAERDLSSAIIVPAHCELVYAPDPRVLPKSSLGAAGSGRRYAGARLCLEWSIGNHLDLDADVNQEFVQHCRACRRIDREVFAEDGIETGKIT